MARKESFDPHEHLSLYRDCLTEASRLGGALMEQLILDARKSLHLREQAFVDPVQLAAVRNASALLNKHAALLCESFPVLLRGEFGLETGAEKAQKPGNSSLSFDSLELMDESQVEETVELARAQQIAVQAVESRLAELDALICAAQGLRTVRADRNPLRPEVYVRTLRAAVMQTQAPAVTRLHWMQHLGMGDGGTHVIGHQPFVETIVLAGGELQHTGIEWCALVPETCHAVRLIPCRPAVRQVSVH